MVVSAALNQGITDAESAPTCMVDILGHLALQAGLAQPVAHSEVE